MELKICNFCRKEYLDSDVEGFCSKECEIRSKKASFTTISIRHEVRNRVILLQNEILQKTNRKIPYSDLLDHIFDIAEKMMGNDFLSDKIINDYKYFL